MSSASSIPSMTFLHPDVPARSPDLVPDPGSAPFRPIERQEGATALRVLLNRRSDSSLHPPGPTAAQLEAILQAAGTVPDHGALRPWRAVVVSEQGRGAFGDALAAAGSQARGGDLPPEAAEKLRGKAFLAPALVVLIASVQDNAKVPAWEQVASASCAGYAMTLAAYAQGLGAVWKSAPYLEGSALTDLLGLAEGEQLLGWVNLGQADSRSWKRPRPGIDLSSRVTVLGDAGPTPYA